MGSRVLLADDSVTIQKVVGIIFANEDYELTVVDSGDAALQKARELKPDVMLVDALMPGKNGYEVCSEIRRDPQLSHIALLLMTGAFEAVDEEKNRQSGADDFITKPFESQTLIDMTGRLIALTRQRASQAAAQAPPAAPPAAVAPAPAAVPTAPPADDTWGAGFDEFAEEVSPVQAPVFTAPAPAAYAPPVQAVAATTDDDLWGIFDMDAIEAPSAAPPEQIQTAPVTAGDDDFFSFDAEPPLAATAPVVDEFLLEDEVLTETVTAPETATGFEPFGEEEFSFGEEEFPEVPVEVTPLSLEEDFSTISFDEPEPAPVMPPVPPVMAAPAAEPAAAVAPVSVPAPEPVVAPPAARTAPPAPAAVPASLDEEQLKLLLSKVSRDVIEKIVWEVVPDLAEAIIREEIRKIKEGIGR